MKTKPLIKRRGISLLLTLAMVLALTPPLAVTAVAAAPPGDPSAQTVSGSGETGGTLPADPPAGSQPETGQETGGTLPADPPAESQPETGQETGGTLPADPPAESQPETGQETGGTDPADPPAESQPETGQETGGAQGEIPGLEMGAAPLLAAAPLAAAPEGAFSEIYIDVETASGTETRTMRNVRSGSYLDGDYNLQYSLPSGGFLARYQDGVLTLSGCHCKGIRTPTLEQGHLTIDLIGENTIDAERNTGISLNGRSGSSLTITSQLGGSLAISVLSDGYRGINADDTTNIHYSLTIGGNAKIAINVRGDGQASGIAGNDISIIDQASVDITVGGLTHAVSNSGFINGILISASSSGPCNFLLDTTGKVNIDVSDINADEGYSTGINATGSQDLRHVGEMTIRWATTDSRYGGPLSPAGTEFSQEHAINIDENNCYASYRAGKPYTVNVSYGKLTGKGVPYPKQSGNFLWYDTITLSANDYPVSDSDPTLVPFLRWEAQQGTITGPTVKNGAKLDFLDPPTADRIEVEAVHGAFSEVPVFVPTAEGKGTLFFKLFRGGGRNLYLEKADTLEIKGASFSSSSDVTGEATRYYNTSEGFTPAGEYRMQVQYGTGIFYSQPFTIDYTTAPPPEHQCQQFVRVFYHRPGAARPIVRHSALRDRRRQLPVAV